MAAHRLGVFIGKSDSEIWNQFKTAYPELEERYLREIHIRWVNALREAGYRGK